MAHVLIVYDVDGWALCHAATGLLKYVPPGTVAEAVSHEAFYAMRASEVAESDVLLVLSFHTDLAPFAERLRAKGRRIVRFVGSHALMHYFASEDWRTLGVTLTRNRNLAEEHLPHCDMVICQSHQLADSLRPLNPHTIALNLGVDTDVFSPIHGSDEQRDYSLVGFCAQPADFKGQDAVWEPLCEGLSSAAKCDHVCRTYHTALPPNRMAAWYRSLGVLVVCSTLRAARVRRSKPRAAVRQSCLLMSEPCGIGRRSQTSGSLCRTMVMPGERVE